MNRAVTTGTVYNAWRPLAEVCQGMDGATVLEAALSAALEQERTHRRIMGGRYVVGPSIYARLFILQHANLAVQPGVPVPKSWTAVAQEPRARSLAYALGEQIRSRKLQTLAFPRLDFTSINYVDHIVVHARKETAHG